ncbi:MAG TPA: sensor histidine kinase [Candidatus Udaeobacter sp.]|nr:sensor histidine kinase [Candidatus Udaeobacter sp.]
MISAISSFLESDDDTSGFFGRLSETIAGQLGASRAAFWRLGSRGALSPQPSAFGFARASRIPSLRFQLSAGGPGVLERIVFDDELELAKGTSRNLDRLWRDKGISEVSSSIAAAWRAGDRRIGAVVAFDSRRGFTPQDLWLLRMAGMAAGMVSQYREAEEDLGQTAVRLEEAMTARRHLLNNIAAGGDEARRRFASALHDDSLQLLTGAELQVERVRAELNGDHKAADLDQLMQTLRKVEDSLRRLLINVSPEPISIPHDLRAAISERVEELRVRAGIEGHVESRLPDHIPHQVQTMVFKNIAEALTNVEKHARATRVTVVAEEFDGGIRIEVTDNGTGFVVAESVHVPGHIGLVALRERAQLAGGTCRIESEPGTGTTIEFWVPMSL